MCLVVLVCVAGLVAFGSTLSALVALQEIQAIIEILRGPTGADWTQFGFDATATRHNPVETHITAANVASLRLRWRLKLPEIADSTPAFLHGLRFPDGRTRDVLYLTTRSGSLIAVDADSGVILWQQMYPMFDPNKITTSSPVADAAHGVVYSCAMDGKVHKYDAITGKEHRDGGWPVAITTMRASEKASSALNINHGFLYATTASFGGDAPPYQGHVVAINLANGTTRVFNAVCSNLTHLLAPNECRDNGAGIWARPGVVVDPLTGNIFVTTGNAPYTADRGGHDWGDSVLELTPDGGRLLDSYTPQRPDDYYQQDLDLGSAAPVLLPAIAHSSMPDLAIQAGKDAQLRLLNRANLSGQGGPGHLGGELQTMDAPNHCPVLTQPAVWIDPRTGAVWVLITSGCAIGGYQVSAEKDGKPRMRLVWTVPAGATSPIVAGGVLFAATTGNKEILALDPRTGRQLWTSGGPHAGGSIGYTHWENPIVVNGRLYCTDENGDLVAYGLPQAQR
jgi:outer membrane protein assembly factor BamB